LSHSHSRLSRSAIRSSYGTESRCSRAVPPSSHSRGLPNPEGTRYGSSRRNPRRLETGLNLTARPHSAGLWPLPRIAEYAQEAKMTIGLESAWTTKATIPFLRGRRRGSCETAGKTRPSPMVPSHRGKKGRPIAWPVPGRGETRNRGNPYRLSAGNGI